MEHTIEGAIEVACGWSDSVSDETEGELLAELAALRAAAEEGARYKVAVEKLERMLRRVDWYANVFDGVPGWDTAALCKADTLLAAIEAAKEE